MVTRRSLSDCSNSTNDANDEGQDTISVATTASSDSEESTTSHHNELVLSQDINKDDKAGFSNIAVTNSTDIHFGNKTYYQGPVTIKQFLYSNPQISNEVSDDDKLAIKNDTFVLDSVPDTVIIGKDNPSYVPDSVGIKLKNGSEKQQINGDVTCTEHTEVRKGTRWLRNISRQQVISVVVAVVLLISLITLLRVFLTKHQTNPVSNPGITGDTDEAQMGSPAIYPIDPNVTVTLPENVYMLTRKEWLAKPASEKLDLLKLPVPYVIIMHTAQENCSDIATCSFHVRQAQLFHMDSRGWGDIGYSFLVGGDGNAYEGRGWKYVGAQVYGYNTKCIGIAFIGTFNQVMPPERQIKAAKKLIEIGLNESYIAKDYKLLAARQLQTTQSPGLLLYEDVKKWPHWSQKP